jgi:thymidylate synthase
VVPPARRLNPAFAVAEALWILSGSDDPWIFAYNRSLAQYADDGRLRGAYGPRMRRWRGEVDQLVHVRDLLQRDPDSRQAVIQLYDPHLDTRGNRDVPCTLNYRFFLREGRLDMHTTMRSNDIWLGLPYDVFTATILHEIMADWLSVELGTYHHHVDSLHLYAHHHAEAEMVAAAPVTESPPMAPLHAPTVGFTEFLTSIITGHPDPASDQIWHDFAAVMHSYRLWTGGDRLKARAMASDVGGDFGEALRRWYEHLSAPVTSTAGGTR